ncbi:MAG TPA: AlpA family transcriptional regulator [bacterium]
MNEREPLLFLRLPEVKRRTALGRSTIYKRVEEGTFPAPVRIGSRAVAWSSHEVAEWIASTLASARIASSNGEES